MAVQAVLQSVTERVYNNIVDIIIVLKLMQKLKLLQSCTICIHGNLLPDCSKVCHVYMAIFYQMVVKFVILIKVVYYTYPTGSVLKKRDPF